MTLHAVVYTSEGAEAYDDVGAAIDAPGETWVHATAAVTSDLEAVLMLTHFRRQGWL